MTFLGHYYISPKSKTIYIYNNLLREYTYKRG